MTGSKVMSIHLVERRIRFLDSLNYLPMALRAMPKAMGLPTDLPKGDFPHRLNSMENLGKQFDVHPPLSFYEPQSMAED